MPQGFSDPGGGESGQDKTGVWRSHIPTREWTRSDSNQRFYREVIGWKYVSHPNVLPFLGISETLFPFCIITPWLPNGNIVEYIRQHQGVNRLQLVRYRHKSLQTNRLRLRAR